MNHAVLDDTCQARILSLNLDKVIDRLVTVEHWYEDDAQQAAIQYRRFLYLQAKYGLAHVFAPSLDIDDVWHAHVLHTRDYERDCQALLGRFLHHNPGDSENPEDVKQFQACYAQMCQHYEAEFGEPVYQTRTPTFFRAYNRLKRACLAWVKNRRA